MLWTSEEETCLIDFFQAHVCLWDYNDPSYYRRNKRTELLSELSELLKIQGDGKEFTEKEILKKWKYLRGSFVREVKKAEATSRSGAGTDQQYQTKWSHFQQMLFLKGVVKPKDSRDCGLSPAGSLAEDSPEAEDPLCDSLEPGSSSSSMVENPTEPTKQFGRKRKVDSIDEMRHYSLQKCVEALEEKPKDGEHHFALSVACTLRRFPRLEREKAKLDIQKLLLEYETRISENAIST